jgi:hypothetical protein
MDDATLDELSSLGDLLRLLGDTGLRLASSDVGRDLAVRRTVLHDPHGDLEESSGGLLLGVGVRPDDPAAADLVRLAASRGCSAVLVKEHGAAADRLAAVADQCGTALVVVHDDVEWLPLDALVNNAIRASARLEEPLTSVAIGDLFTLAGAIADTVGGATAIEDFSQRVLAYSSNAAHPTDPERREGILGRKVPYLPENDPQYRAIYRSTGAQQFPATTHDGLGRLAVAVRAGTELLGSIWVVVPDEGLPESAADALAAAPPIAALHLLQARSSADLVRQQRGDASRRLLEGTGNPAVATDVLRLDLGGPFAVLTFAPTHLDDARVATADRLLAMVTLHCETRLGRTGSVLLDGTVFVLAAGSRVGVGSLEGLATEVVETARSSLRLNLLGAVVAPVHAVEDLPRARDEALRVLELLRQRPTAGNVASAAALSEQLVLADLRSLVTADPRLVSARARAVVDHDAEHGTQYAALLLDHFRCLLDVRRTAALLGVHPNTVRYRLRGVASKFELDLTDSGHVLALWIGLHALAPR